MMSPRISNYMNKERSRACAKTQMPVGVPRGLRVLVAVNCCFGLFARERELHYSTDLLDYSIRYDDSLTAGLDMRQVAWMSPFNTEDPGSPYSMAYSQTGTEVDKFFYVPSLEFDASALTGANPSGLRPSDFMENARQVLAYGRNEIQALEKVDVPESLKPVKTYLRENLQFSLKTQELRYDYIAKGKSEPVIQMLCQYCSCESASHAGLIRRLKGATSRETRIELTREPWYNAVLSCRRKNFPKYPLSAWQHFLQEFGIRESARRKGVE